MRLAFAPSQFRRLAVVRSTPTRAFAIAVACASLVGNVLAADRDWLRVDTPYSTVYAQTTERDTLRWMREFELFRRTLNGLLPVPDERLPHVTVLLFRNQREFDPYKPLENGAPAKIAGLFSRAPGRNLIAVSSDGRRDSSRLRLYHEATHWYMSGFNRRLPLWLEEGLAEVFSSFSYSGEVAVLGTERGWARRSLIGSGLMPFTELSRIRGDELEFNNFRGNVQQVYHQSWLAAHELLLGGPHPGGRLLMLQIYLAQPPLSPDPSADLLVFLQRTVPEMDAAWADHLSAKTVQMFRLPIDRTDIGKSWAVTRATMHEMQLTLAAQLLATGQLDAARARLGALVTADAGDGPAWSLLGEVELAADRLPQAMAAWDVAASVGDTSLWTNWNKSARAIDRIETDFGFAVSPAASADALAPVLEVLRREPQFRPGYNLLSHASLRGFPLSAEAADVLAAGLPRYPDSVEIQLGIAHLRRSQGCIAEARLLAQRVIDQAEPPQAVLVANARQLLSALGNIPSEAVP